MWPAKIGMYPPNEGDLKIMLHRINLHIVYSRLGVELVMSAQRVHSDGSVYELLLAFQLLRSFSG